MSNATIWWQRLETNFPLGGPRRHLREIFGAELIGTLERAHILKQRRIADTYPCPLRSGAGCPRAIVDINGVYWAVCSNRPRQCQDLALSAADIAYLDTDPESLCRAVASALQVRPRFEPVPALAEIYRIGTFMPEPGVKYPVFLLIRTSPDGYGEALDALRSRQGGGGFAVLVPTDRFLPNEVEIRMAGAGIMVRSLADILGLESGRLVARADPLRLFTGMGNLPAIGKTSAEIVARALVRRAGQSPSWIDLDQRRYEELRAQAGQYDVFADERERTVHKPPADSRPNVVASYFSTIKAAVSKKGIFDPQIDGPDLTSGKQIFQRARLLFDIKAEKSAWRIFQSVKTEEGHTVYQFRPDATVSFSFIFLPEG